MRFCNNIYLFPLHEDISILTVPSNMLFSLRNYPVLLSKVFVFCAQLCLVERSNDPRISVCCQNTTRREAIFLY